MHNELPLDDYEPVLRPGRRKSTTLAVSEESGWVRGPSAERDKPDLSQGNSDPSPVAVALEQASVADNSSQAEKRTPVRDKWILKRGHALSFFGLFTFTAVLYFRPYELFPSLTALSSMAFWTALVTLMIFFPTQLGLEGNLTVRPREVNLVLLLICAGFLAIPMAIDRSLAFESFTGNFLKASLMFIVMVNVVRTRGRWKALVFLNIAICCLVSAWAVIDFIQGKGNVEGYRVEGRIDGVFKNPNELALNLLIIVPIVLGFLFGSRVIFSKFIYGAIALLMVAGIFVTYSRGGFLGLATASVVYIWKLRRRHKTLAFAFVLMSVMVLVIMLPGGYMNRMMSIVDHSRDAVGSAHSRWELLLLSLKVAARHPIIGIGMRNFEIVSIRGLVTHNAYTQVATEMGIPAMIVFIMFLVSPIKRLRMIELETEGLKEQKWFYYLSVGIQASLAGFMVSIFFGAVAYQWYTYYLVGYAVCLRRVFEMTKDMTKNKPRSESLAGV